MGSHVEEPGASLSLRQPSRPEQRGSSNNELHMAKEKKEVLVAT